jgi:hypothetical protein
VPDLNIFTILKQQNSAVSVFQASKPPNERCWVTSSVIDYQESIGVDPNQLRCIVIE